MAMNLQQTKSRMHSVSSTKKITKAMELVATSKLKKSKDLNTQLTPYKNEVLEVISYCANNVVDKDYRYFKENDINKSLYIVVTSSLGLCGGYNVNLEKFVASIIKGNDDLIVIGSKGAHYFKEKGYSIIRSYNDLPSLSLKESLTSGIALEALADFNLKKYKNVSMIYTKFINSLTFEPTLVKLLPINIIVDVPKIKKELILEPSSEEVLDGLVPFYLQTCIKAFLFESMLSEQASRRTAMENATDNASDLLDKLYLIYNKSRQSAITQEITEISGAANALK